MHQYLVRAECWKFSDAYLVLFHLLWSSLYHIADTAFLVKTDGKYYHYFIVLNLIPDQKGLKCFITLNHLVTVLVKFKKYLKK